jgi:hypothetical protein
VFRLERRDEIEACVVDEVELIEVHVQLGAWWNFFEGRRQHGECKEGRGAVHVQLDLAVPIDALDLQVSE